MLITVVSLWGIWYVPGRCPPKGPSTGPLGLSSAPLRHLITFLSTLTKGNGFTPVCCTHKRNSSRLELPDEKGFLFKGH